ncbi:hypothetical protein C8F04DRAFT_1181016 [Mycena alexandri]|uniref:Uncharacterized protein n=1 Tax=Mycena alexandri TaxID=1745969 RepID=A0AAD6T1D9_9AGAR|nr:hypothetical protein C8F04DRAFT_1181016 [Mycena alexandri]
MSRIDYSDARFKANDPPPPHGRGYREPTFTAGRLEHDETRKRNTESGKKRVQTRDRNRAQQTNEANPQHIAVAPQPAASGLRHPPETPRPMGLPPRVGPGHAPTPQRTPLQPVSLNVTPAYPSLNQLPSSSPLYLPTPPSTQVPPHDGGFEWFTTLSDTDKAALINSRAGASSHDDHGMRDLSVFSTFTKIPLALLQLHTFDNNHNGIPVNNSLLDDKEHESWGPQPANGRGQTPDDGPADRDEQAGAVSSLEINMRTIEPSYPRARKRKRATDEVEDSSEDDDGEEPSSVPPKKKKSRSIADLPEEHQKICDIAFDYLKIELTLRTPFPASVGRGRTVRAHSDKFTELLLTAFTDAAFELELEDLKPTKADLALIRSRVPQFRSGLKAMAREFVPGAYDLVDILTMR